MVTYNEHCSSSKMREGGREGGREEGREERKNGVTERADKQRKFT